MHKYTIKSYLCCKELYLYNNNHIDKMLAIDNNIMDSIGQKEYKVSYFNLQIPIGKV
ncbi:hypothetical protein CSC2_45810 [Clostridium zeae]|uniref:Uncharacterized protein n=1 Tax=Clostridium zeae TaxID=2759022 RepID=A0ABQ1EH26_9CLOT|nr:hypothetical protein CSC2_45810 [Clostridium zeae]